MAEMNLPNKKQRISLSFSFPKPKPKTRIHPDHHTNNPLPPPKRQCTRNPALNVETRTTIHDFLWELSFIEDEKLVVASKARNKFVDYLRVIFDSDPVRVCESFEPGWNDVKAKKEKKKMKRKPWLKSVISRGCDELRKGKMRLKKPLKDLFGPLMWSNSRVEEDEVEWKIEHIQDLFSFMFVPASVPYRG